MKFLSNFELPLWLTCNQIDIKKVISIKYGWNTIAWEKIRQMRHFVQNLLVAKVYTSKCYKMKGNTMLMKRQCYRYYQEKNLQNLKTLMTLPDTSGLPIWATFLEFEFSFIWKGKVIDITKKKIKMGPYHIHA